MNDIANTQTFQPKPAAPQKQSANRFQDGQLAATGLHLSARLLADSTADWAGDEPKLPPKEQLKFERELREIDEAEQYALVAEEDGWYPCLKCPNAQIYLFKGEVWKYGFTRKGQYRRYTYQYLIENKFKFVTQFIGTVSECMKEEKRKIYFYRFLPENMVRPSLERLIRPPGNARSD